MYYHCFMNILFDKHSIAMLHQSFDIQHSYSLKNLYMYFQLLSPLRDDCLKYFVGYMIPLLFTPSRSLLMLLIFIIVLVSVGCWQYTMSLVLNDLQFHSLLMMFAHSVGVSSTILCMFLQSYTRVT